MSFLAIECLSTRQKRNHFFKKQLFINYRYSIIILMSSVRTYLSSINNCISINSGLYRPMHLMRTKQIKNMLKKDQFADLFKEIIVWRESKYEICGLFPI